MQTGGIVAFEANGGGGTQWLLTSLVRHYRPLVAYESKSISTVVVDGLQWRYTAVAGRLTCAAERGCEVTTLRATVTERVSVIVDGESSSAADTQVLKFAVRRVPRFVIDSVGFFCIGFVCAHGFIRRPPPCVPAHWLLSSPSWYHCGQ